MWCLTLPFRNAVQAWIDLSDETKETATGFMARALDHFERIGVTVERILTDNGIKHKRTRPYRPQTNGKVERFHRTPTEEWAYAGPYRCERERRDALPARLHWYNHHRGHTALVGNHPPPAYTTSRGNTYDLIGAKWSDHDAGALHRVLARPARARQHEYELPRYGLDPTTVEAAFGNYGRWSTLPRPKTSHRRADDQPLRHDRAEYGEPK
ncbi:hypothetical protein GCM10027447_27880 [Glycomyces halotolerans]